MHKYEGLFEIQSLSMRLMDLINDIDTNQSGADLKKRILPFFRSKLIFFYKMKN